MNRNRRIAAQFLLFCTLMALVQRFVHHPASVRVIRKPAALICRFVLVESREPNVCEGRATDEARGDAACRWDVRVTTSAGAPMRSLGPSSEERFSGDQVQLLRKLDGCDSVQSCGNQSVPCVYGLEDPSDALWVRSYDQDTKFMVLLRIGFASLLFFIFAIICDGTIFQPQRQGSFAISSASLLAMIAFASLLYILVVPRHMQFSLYGKGPLQSLAYMSVVLIVAASLPGVAITWISFCVLVIYFVGFLVEQSVSLVAGIFHFLGALSLYQMENTLFHLRLIYNRDTEDDAVLDRRLLQISERFLRRVQGNFFLYRIVRTLEQDAIQVVENTLPDDVFDDLMMHERIPEVDMDHLDDPNVSVDTESLVNSRTPLLMRNSPP